ncbi:uncharacterized protein LOC108021867 isoform X10 [Drosophila biarmipes]|uniref:uncharacterized protein LOC108021867 isoform X10 n=1 Tax=Drosophila biarmipes TaxID=125945 RepID=UPI0021CC9A41|nr:uncharacterized protein LOC108021867 isoform X10 [Drosophila biarmipes]
MVRANRKSLVLHFCNVRDDSRSPSDRITEKLCFAEPIFNTPKKTPAMDKRSFEIETFGKIGNRK